MGNLVRVMLAVLAVWAATAEAALEKATPESQGVSSSAILTWIDACDAKMKYLHGFVIVRHGKTIAEGTWAPYDTLNRPHMLYSHSKSFTSTAIGFLVDEGNLDLDELVVDIFADKLPDEPCRELQHVRVRDLLTMNFGSCPDKGARSNQANPDWEKGILARPFERMPGRKHRYDSDATYLLSCIVERKSGRRTMDYLKEKLFDPLGMTTPWSTVSTTGTACGGWGMNVSTRDLAKFGQLLLNEGVWEGRRLLSAEWVQLATGLQTKTGGNPEISDWAHGYGFQFWRCRHGAYRADGASGQYTIVLKDQDTVISLNAGDGDMQRELNLVWEHLLPALGETALPEDPQAQAKLAARCAALKLPVLENKGLAGAELPRECMFAKSDLLPAGEGRLEKTADGWVLVAGGRRFALGDGTWAETVWKFDGSDVEACFQLVGTRTVAASAAWTAARTLRVRWFLLGATQKGEFEIKIK